MTKYYLSEERWALIADRLPGKEGAPGRHGRDNRLFIEAVFWIVRTGWPWRSLPPRFGKWYTNYARFRRWTQKRVWPGVLNALKADPTCEYFYEGGAIRHALRRRVAQDAAAARVGRAEPEPGPEIYRRRARRSAHKLLAPSWSRHRKGGVGSLRRRDR